MGTEVGIPHKQSRPFTHVFINYLNYQGYMGQDRRGGGREERLGDTTTLCMYASKADYICT